MISAGCCPRMLIYKTQYSPMFSKNDSSLWIVMISPHQLQSDGCHYPWKTRATLEMTKMVMVA